MARTLEWNGSMIRVEAWKWMGLSDAEGDWNLKSNGADSGRGPINRFRWRSTGSGWTVTDLGSIHLVTLKLTALPQPASDRPVKTTVDVQSLQVLLRGGGTIAADPRIPGTRSTHIRIVEPGK